MRKLLVYLVLVFILAGCSKTLEGAISKSGYGEYDEPEILYQDDEVGVVIFLTKDMNGEYIICRSSFEKNNFNRYEVNTTNDFSISVDIARKSEFIRYDTIGEHTDNPQNIVWGGIFNYPGAKQVDYKIHSDEGTVIRNQVKINKKHIFVDVLSDEIADSHSITFDVKDREGNVMFSFN